MRYAIFIALLFFASQAPAQKLISITHSCSFDGEEEQTEFYTFDASREADRIVGQIVNAVNLSKNFVIKSADCKNALATMEGRDRYILYNTLFLEKFKQTGKTKWGAYCVLAHEIGHHLNNHDFTSSDSRKRKEQELQADKFAGGVLFTLGASLEETQAGIELLQSSGESKTHPPASARAEAMASGWKNAQEIHRQRSEVDGDNGEQPERSNPENSNTDNRKSEPAKEPAKATTKPQGKLPDPVQQPPTQPQNNPAVLTDQQIRNGLVGQWETAYFNGVYNVNTIATLNANGTGVGYLYQNGVLTNTVYVTWIVQNGYYIEQYSGTQFYSKLAVYFYNNNSIAMTMAETNMATGFPVGTVLYYTRRF